LKEFLSPFRLPRTLQFSFAGCDGEADAFYSDDKITVCYEYIAELWKYRPEQTTALWVTPMDAVIGPLIDTSLHEFGHALTAAPCAPTCARRRRRRRPAPGQGSPRDACTKAWSS